MTLEQWKQLQDEYGIKIIGAKYKSMSVEEGKHYLKILSDNFDIIYNDEED